MDFNHVVKYCEHHEFLPCVFRGMDGGTEVKVNMGM